MIFDTLNEFYRKIIEPEFRTIRNKLSEHDQKFKDIFDHFDKIYRIKEESLNISHFEPGA